jgi:hypothetical protein
MKRTFLKLLVASLVSIPFTTHAANILMIVDAVSAAGTANLAQDREVVDRLTARGHKVTIADDQDGALDGYFAGQDLILISSSVGSGNEPLHALAVSDLVTRRVPIISCEPGLYDELKFQVSTAFGNTAPHTFLDMTVANQSHPLAAGKSGQVSMVNPGTTAVFSSSDLPINVGTNAILIATNGSPGVDLGKLAIWGYESGAKLVDNTSTAPARRVAFFFNATTAAGVYNTDAYDLFFAAVNWALGTGSSNDKTPPTLVEAKTAGNANGLLVSFSEPVSPSTATNKANYAIDNGVTVNSAQLWQNNYTVLLSTTTIAPGRAYQVTVNGVQDVATPANTLAANTKAPFLQVDGIIERRVFQVSGGNIAAITNSAKFAQNQPDQVTYPTLLEGPVNYLDNYGTQFRGYVTAPTTGDYIFFICSDDPSALYLSTDENPANKKLIARETVWSDTRRWQTSGGNSDLSAKRSDQFASSEWPTPNKITLTAGRRYYIEALQAEGSGGDNVAVTWVLPGGAEPVDGDSPITGSYLSGFGFTPGPVGITTQPASQTAGAPSSATFTVVPSGNPPYTYQWFRNGTVVTNATSQSYTVPSTAIADNGARYSVQVSNPFSSVTSSAATLTVTSDPVPPALYRADGSPTLNQITLVFSEAVGPSSTNLANFSIPGLTVTAAKLAANLGAGGTNVVLTTSLQTTGTVYTITVKDIKDLAGNTIIQNPSTIKMTAWILTRGGALQKYWDNITANNIAGLTNNPRFPDNPTFVTIEPAFEYPAGGLNEAGSTYGNQMTALLSPPVTGDYVFFVCSDDPSVLFLSTDEKPSNKKLIARETAWSNARQWQSSGGSSDLSAKRSDQFTGSEWPTPNVIRLTAGRLYYIEALHTEGGGGDNIGVAWQVPGEAEPNDTEPPIQGTNLFTYINPSVVTLFAIDDKQVWRYNRDGLDLGTAWKDPKFDDSKWPSGKALIADETGAVAEPIRTPISVNTDAGVAYPTLYVRGHFNFPGNSSAGVVLNLRDVIDDGAVFYLNGVEVYRFSMGTTGPVTFNTLATSHENAYDGPIIISAASLVPGDNVFAVEIHQTGLTSSDIVFGAELKATIPETVSAPTTGGPKLTGITRTGTSLKIDWTGGGTLQSADNVTGPWTDVANASSPFTTTLSVAKRFYRVKQ